MKMTTEEYDKITEIMSSMRHGIRQDLMTIGKCAFSLHDKIQQYEIFCRNKLREAMQEDEENNGKS